MNRKEFLKVTTAASIASLLSPLSAYAETFSTTGKKLKSQLSAAEVYLILISPTFRNVHISISSLAVISNRIELKKRHPLTIYRNGIKI